LEKSKARVKIAKKVVKDLKEQLYSWKRERVSLEGRTATLSIEK